MQYPDEYAVPDQGEQKPRGKTSQSQISWPHALSLLKMAPEPVRTAALVATALTIERFPVMYLDHHSVAMAAGFGVPLEVRM